MSEYDIYNSGLIGVESSAITTILDNNSSMRDSKVISTNPNFAAFIIEMLYDAELEKGDTVAVSMTGSFPGANIAFFIAAMYFVTMAECLFRIGALLYTVLEYGYQNQYLALMP